MMGPFPVRSNPMLSHANIRRAEIALAVFDRGLPFVPDEARDGWRTVGDVVRSVAAGRRPQDPPLNEADVLAVVRQVIADGWGIPPEQITPDADLCGAGLRLDHLPFMRPRKPE